MRFQRILGRSLTVIAATMMLFSVAEAKKPPAPTNTGSCPNTADLGTFQQASNVSASFSNSGNTTTYSFSSLTDEHPVKGVPGLIKYCVYPSPAEQPTSIQVDNAVGDNGAKWVSGTTTKSFSFARPGGNASNIGLRGQTIADMGTATWATVPTDQTILLHINDPAVCHGLYGADTPGTCFVLPLGGPICDAGDGDILAAYNVIPFGAVDCGAPSWGFEARSTNELGQEVTLDHAGELVSLNVVFNSYACSTSGHWDGILNGQPALCVTTTPTTFNLPMIAKIYAVDTSSSGCSPTTPCKGDVLAGPVTVDQTLPYRPSADSTDCSAGAFPGAAWYNPNGQRSTGLGFGGEPPTPSTLPGDCEYSAKKELTFTFPTGTMLSGNVIWTVQFNTTNHGYDPIGPTTCNDNNNNPGCPYDSLNVATLLYPNSPYAGDLPDPTAAFVSVDSGGLLRNTTAYGDPGGWTDFPPLGEIITK